MRSALRATALAIALLVCGAAPTSAAPAERCAPPSASIVQASAGLVRAALIADGKLTIVCLGSSSTQGVGATAPGRTYPAQLDAILKRRLPGLGVEVANRGIGGEVVSDNLNRLDRDALALRPDLVVWQVGTNDALRGLPPVELARTAEAGC
jgi:lysophospholipase L1-like esterase